MDVNKMKMINGIFRPTLNGKLTQSENEHNTLGSSG